MRERKNKHLVFIDHLAIKTGNSQLMDERETKSCSVRFLHQIFAQLLDSSDYFKIYGEK